jgi:hypothetical protein
MSYDMHPRTVPQEINRLVVTNPRARSLSMTIKLSLAGHFTQRG